MMNSVDAATYAADEAMWEAQAMNLSEKRVYGHIRKIERELFHLWGFVGSEGLWEEACEYMVDHRGEETPFEW